MPLTRLRPALAAAAVVACAAAVLTATAPAGSSPDPGTAALPLGQAHTWLTDRQGRAVVLHGLNQVSKTAPYAPAADGFSDDDAAFLEANGFNAMRIGVIWAAVEPRPGVYDDAYLDSIASTVDTLEGHGIVSLLDFHQDLWNERFQGEGAPAWAVQDGGLPNPQLGFPGNYFANLAQDRAWDSFWANRPAADGVGLQDHLARAWAHVAARFRDSAAVMGYEVLNEPWPGTLWEPCALPVLGCPLFDATLTRFYQRVATAIRTADPVKTVWIEPNVLFSYVAASNLGTVKDPAIGLAFHDYCGIEAFLKRNTGCSILDGISMSTAKRYSTSRDVPWLLTEFGATMDLPNISGVMDLADRNRLGWLEWAYTGGDITSADPDGQTLVRDPTLPPTGDNVVVDKLRVLARPYPKVVAGVPTSWSFRSGVFTLTYSTQRADGSGAFPPGSETAVSTPAVEFPTGYRVGVTGATVASGPDAPTLRLLSDPGARSVTVTVSPR